MASSLDALLLLEGALIGAVVLARMFVVRSLDPEVIPTVIRPRVLLGNRLTPAFAVLAAALFAGGLVLLAVGG